MFMLVFLTIKGSSTPLRSPRIRPSNMLSQNEEQCQRSLPKEIRRGYTKRETSRVSLWFSIHKNELLRSLP